MSERESGRNPASEPKQQTEGNEVEEKKRPCFLFCQDLAECFDDIRKGDGGEARMCSECFKLQDKIERKAREDERARIVNVINKHKLVVTSMDTQMTEKSVHNQCCRDIISKIQGV